MTSPAEIPPAWRGILDPGETLLWQGRPSGKVVARARDIVVTLFGAVFFSFACFWVWMAASIEKDTPAAYIFPLFGLPFIAVGAYLMVGRYFIEAFVRRNTWYTLTNRRAFIATEVLGRRDLASYLILPDTEIVLVEEKAGMTVNFATKLRRSARTGKSPAGADHHVPIGFELLKDGREVYDLLQKVRRRAGSPVEEPTS